RVLIQRDKFAKTAVGDGGGFLRLSQMAASDGQYAWVLDLRRHFVQSRGQVVAARAHPLRSGRLKEGAVERRADTRRPRHLAQAVNQINQFCVASVSAGLFKRAARDRLLMHYHLERVALPGAQRKLAPFLGLRAASQLAQSEKQLAHSIR